MQHSRLILGIVSAVVASGGLTLALDGCTVAPDTYIAECDPDPLFPSKYCPGDAGSDADAADDASQDGPGVDPQAHCTGRCVPAPSGSEAGFWSEVPLLVWIGPADEVPSECPKEVAPNEKFRRFADLIAPPASCDLCGCEKSEGTCTGLPEEIRVQAGTCGQSGIETLPFDGPVGWDGSCSSADALPEGAKCPAGSSSFCAQSIWASALPGPTSEGCAVTVTPAPKFNVETRWNLAALACHANTREDDCASDSQYCVNDLPLPWSQCVWRAGLHEECPGDYSFVRYWTYIGKVIDDRKCNACECGAPVGSACLGTLRLYDDAACTSEFEKLSMSSYGEKCVTMQPPGRALGAEAITDLTYKPGTCVASGGEPTGEAKADETDAVTFCCLPPFYAVE